MDIVTVDRAWRPFSVRLAPSVSVCVNDGYSRLWVNLALEADPRWKEALCELSFQQVPAPTHRKGRWHFYVARAGSPWTTAGANHARSLLWHLCETAYRLAHP